jgi:hypothetical protein
MERTVQHDIPSSRLRIGCLAQQLPPKKIAAQDHHHCDGFDQPELKMERWLPPQPTREEWPDADIQRASLERAVEGEAAPLAMAEVRPKKNLVRHTRHTCLMTRPVDNGNVFLHFTALANSRPFASSLPLAIDSKGITCDFEPS